MTETDAQLRRQREQSAERSRRYRQRQRGVPVQRMKPGPAKLPQLIATAYRSDPEKWYRFVTTVMALSIDPEFAGLSLRVRGSTGDD